MKKYDVFGIGNALVDCVCLVKDSFLKENNIEKGLMTLVDQEKQKLLIEKIKTTKPYIQSGGSVMNSIFALSQLGGSGYASFLVSDDEFGNIFINDLKNNNVKTGGKKYTISDGMTGSCLVLTTPDAERTMNTCLSISANYSIKNINFDDLKNSKFLYIEGYLVTSELAMQAIQDSISFCKKNNIKVALTFSDLSMVKYHKNGFESILKNNIDLLFCNEEEALTFSEKNSLKEASEFLLQFSKIVVITRGDKGSIIVNFKEKIIIDSIKTQAIDTVGAGDAFSGSFLYGITNGMNLENSGKLASVLSSKVVSKIGPRLNKENINIIKKSLL
jgi:sugar/nucleoside kinase (ribokinase family)|tara:strand:+ start:1545 stop:2537 length:993 start_codon:yes stop_codon:yes gene_type:complete